METVQVYFISYYYHISLTQHGYGRCEVSLNENLSKVDDILEMESMLEKKLNYEKLIIINFIHLRTEMKKKESK